MLLFCLAVIVGIQLVEGGNLKKNAQFYPVDVWGEYVGCFPGSIIPTQYVETNAQMTYATCWRSCQHKQTKYAGLFNGNSCYCSNSDYSSKIALDDSSCSLQCGGDKYQTCGATNAVTYFYLQTDETRLRQVIKNMEVPNIYVYKDSDGGWTRYNNNSIDLMPTEVIPNENIVVLYDDCTRVPVALQAGCALKYINLVGSIDLIFLVPSSTTPPTTIQINALWDIVFALRKSDPSKDDVMFFRKTACNWLKKINGDIVDEYRLYEIYEIHNQDDLLVVLQNVNDSTDKVSIGPNYMLTNEYGTTKYAGKWFNQKKPLSYYFFSDLFQCHPTY